MHQYKVISQKEPHSPVSEQYRKLATNIDFSSFEKELKLINLTSTFPREGKTVTCLNLATVYSQNKKKTLLIDLDLRKPKMHRAFEVPNKGGVSDYITGKLSLEEAVLNVDENLDLLVAGEKLPFPAEALSSTKLKDMLTSLRNDYDRIIIDCPPLTAVADANIISNYCDGTVYVTASRKTNRDVASQCIKELKDNGANILGGVLTMVQKKDHYYGMEYYYYYGN
jgi:capsular exopolysaccharide synthesis family protein